MFKCHNSFENLEKIHESKDNPMAAESEILTLSWYLQDYSIDYEDVL